MSEAEKRILIVDDEVEHLESLRRIFEREKYQVDTAVKGKEALEKLRQKSYLVMLTDLIMPGGVDGMDLLKAVKALGINTEIVLMTAYGTVETAVQAMKVGAYDFITKPIRRIEVIRTIERAIDRVNLMEENRRLKEQLKRFMGDGVEIIGSSPALARPMEILRQAAPSVATILIQGDSGTGKELFARAIHEMSGRSGPFVPINCAALPESILETELFGHEKGAFTGAIARKEGRFETADGGTLFLDEIGDMSPAIQAKVLRVLQDGEFERVGGTQPIKVDVRIISATNKNLRREIEARRFREDLFFRLNVIAINLPPLSERREDIPLLARHFLEKYCRKNHREIKGFSPRAMETLITREWRGNVRELEKSIERAVVLTRGEYIEPGDLFDEIPLEQDLKGEIRVPFGIPLEEIERKIILETLHRTGGDKKLTAQILGVASRTIYRKMGQLQGENDNEPENSEDSGTDGGEN